MNIPEGNVTSKALFISGCLLAVLGLGCSLTQLRSLSVAGASATLLAMLCGIGIIYLHRVRRNPPVLPRSKIFLLTISVLLIVAVAGNLYSLRYPAWHAYLQPLMMFVLAVQLLMNVASFRDSSAV